MIKVISIELAIVAKPRMTRSDRWRQRPCVVRYWEFADKLKEAVALEDFKLGDKVHMEFHIEMPKSWRKKKREKMEGQPHQLPKKYDIDNLQNSIYDILRPNDDGRIYDIQARKYWADKPMIKIGNGNC